MKERKISMVAKNVERDQEDSADIQFWLSQPVAARIAEVGFASLGLKEEDFLQENYVTQLGYPPLRIDILNSISGVDFDEAYGGKVETHLEDLNVAFICVDDFIRNKHATGRLKDLGDVESLKGKTL